MLIRTVLLVVALPLSYGATHSIASTQTHVAASRAANPAERLPVAESSTLEPASLLPTLDIRHDVVPRPKTPARAHSNEMPPLHTHEIPAVPFYSQFADISDPYWQKNGCGIAAIAMLIEHHTTTTPSVEGLLARGRENGYFLPHAGWTHAGLINLTRPYGLTGQSVGLHHLAPSAALDELQDALRNGPVMASVHYTFEPTNPIPHLVVITGIDGDTVHYNDPAEASGGGTISVSKFQRAWKQRYIAILPTA